MQTDDDVILNRIHPRLAALDLRFIRSNRVIWLWRGLGELGTVEWGPFPSLEYTEWALGQIEQHERGMR
jgi:hypothetical protein